VCVCLLAFSLLFVCKQTNIHARNNKIKEGKLHRKNQMETCRV
jgi:hypothetical protein